MLEFRCQRCEHSFRANNDLAGHLAGHRHCKDNGKNYACQNCSVRTTGPKALERHLTKNDSHMRTTAFRNYQHAIKQGLSPSEAQAYVLRFTLQHAQQRGTSIHPHTLSNLDMGVADPAFGGKYICRPCKLFFLKPSDLTIHLCWPACHDQDGTQFTCGECNLRFDSRRDLLAHLRDQSEHMRIKEQNFANATPGRSPQEVKTADCQESDAVASEVGRDEGTAVSHSFDEEDDARPIEGGAGEISRGFFANAFFICFSDADISIDIDSSNSDLEESVPAHVSNSVIEDLTASKVRGALARQEPEKMEADAPLRIVSAGWRPGLLAQGEHKIGFVGSAIPAKSETQDSGASWTVDGTRGQNFKDKAVRAITGANVALPVVVPIRTWPSMSNARDFLSGSLCQKGVEAEEPSLLTKSHQITTVGRYPSRCLPPVGRLLSNLSPSTLRCCIPRIGLHASPMSVGVRMDKVDTIRSYSQEGRWGVHVPILVSADIADNHSRTGTDSSHICWTVTRTSLIIRVEYVTRVLSKQWPSRNICRIPKRTRKLHPPTARHDELLMTSKTPARWIAPTTDPDSKG